MIKELCMGCALIFILLLMPCEGWSDEQGDAAIINSITMLAKSLKFSDEQLKQIVPVLTIEMRQIQSLSTKNISQEEQKKQKAKLQLELKFQLERYLTKDQLAQWNEMVARATQQNSEQKGSGKGVRHQDPSELAPIALMQALQGLDEVGVLLLDFDGVIAGGVGGEGEVGMAHEGHRPLFGGLHLGLTHATRSPGF